MKNIINSKFLSLIAVLITVLGCDKFLEEDLRGSITPDNFFTNDQEAVLAVNGVYRILLSVDLYDQRGLDLFLEMGTDTQHSNRNTESQFYNYTVEPSTPEVNLTWIQLYRIVTNTNEFILNIDGNENISEDTQNQTIGELLFLRALAYYNLTNIYGDVPYLRDKLDPISGANIGRDSKDSIRNDMKADLEMAKGLLPSSYSGSDKIRPSKYAAAMLKAKFNLIDREWEETKNECDFIIENSSHRLLDNYADVFDQSDPANQYNDEHIFVIDFTSDQGEELSSRRTDMYNPRIRDEPVNRNGDTIVNGVSLKRSSYFEEILSERNEGMTGFGKAIPMPEISRRENWQNGDLRYDASIVTEYLGWKLNFPYYRKNWNLNQQTSLRQNHPENYVIFRLADVYLMAAEAENEMNGPGGAYNYVNAVRERAFEPDQPLAGMTKTSFREAMFNERKFELAAEGHRKIDLIRWGIFIDVVSSMEQASFNNAATNVRPHHILWPIPEQQILLNPALLESDPTNNGYN